MAREKFQTLTEQMFYILLCLGEPCCGVDIMERVRQVTQGRVVIGPGTLYTLLEDFCQEGWIREVATHGRRRTYQITNKGEQRITEETARLRALLQDYSSLRPEVRKEESS